MKVIKNFMSFVCSMFIASNKEVTNRQGRKFAKLARKYEVSMGDLEFELDNPVKLKEFLLQLKNNNPLGSRFIELKIRAEKFGARIYLLTNLPVNYDCFHDSKMKINTRSDETEHVDQHYNIESEVVRKNILLFNWPKKIVDYRNTYKKVLNWGNKNNLKKTTPHDICAIGMHYPTLNDDLGQRLDVVETTSYKNEAFAARWNWVDKSYVNLYPESLDIRDKKNLKDKPFYEFGGTEFEFSNNESTIKNVWFAFEV